MTMNMINNVVYVNEEALDTKQNLVEALQMYWLDVNIYHLRLLFAVGF